jgi:hypothetical protein
MSEFQGPSMLTGSVALARAIRTSTSTSTRIYCASWAVIGLLSIAIYVAATHQGLAFTDPDYGIVAALASTLLISEIFGRNRRIGEMLRYLILWLATFPLGNCLCYLMASLRLPLIDSALDKFDKALGFDWLAWFRFVNAYPAFEFALFTIYSTVAMQIVFSIIYFSRRQESHRCNELWWTAVISASITAVASGVFPAIGTFEYYGVADAQHGVHLHDLHGLRDNTLTSFSLLNLQGIVTLPSYHTVLTILLTYIYRSHRRMLLFVVPVNALQLLSIPSEGGHYIADMLAGGAVAAFAIWVVHRAGLGADNALGTVTIQSLRAAARS